MTLKYLAFAVSLALAGTAAAQQTTKLSIGTGGTGGVYYPLGGGMANVLSKYLPSVQATAEVAGLQLFRRFTLEKAPSRSGS